MKSIANPVDSDLSWCIMNWRWQRPYLACAATLVHLSPSFHALSTLCLREWQWQLCFFSPKKLPACFIWGISWPFSSYTWKSSKNAPWWWQQSMATYWQFLCHQSMESHGIPKAQHTLWKSPSWSPVKMKSWRVLWLSTPWSSELNRIQYDPILNLQLEIWKTSNPGILEWFFTG